MYCPPSADCLLTRLQSSGNLCAVPQGEFEPVVCPPGFYCPPGKQQQIQCPRGHFCPIGTVTPFKCTTMSICTAGSSHQVQLLGMFLCLLLDVLMIGGCLILRSSSPSSRLTRYLHLNKFRSRPPFDEKGANSNFPRSKEFHEYFANDGTPCFRLDLTFTDICLHPRHAQRNILSGLRGTVHSGSVLGIIGASGSGKCENR